MWRQHQYNMLWQRPSLQTAALCEVMKILKGAGFDAKRPDRLDVAMCKDLPIKLVHASGSVRCKSCPQQGRTPGNRSLALPCGKYRSNKRQPSGSQIHLRTWHALIWDFAALSLCYARFRLVMPQQISSWHFLRFL